MEEKIAQFRAITDASHETAVHLLDACGGNLETAIECFLQQNENGLDADDNQKPSTSKNGDAESTNDELIRAPIEGRSGVLVEETFERSYAPARQPRQTNSVFAKFRDFEAETKKKEEEIRANKSKKPTSSGESKRKALELLFRPPVEIMHHGNFETAKLAASSSGHWLMVNVQKTDEFACQVLNRDVWNNGAVRELVQGSFILWQIHNDTADGQRFSMYYRVSTYPFVCILDPRTGELLESLKTNDAVSFCDSVSTFLERHPPLKSHISNANESGHVDQGGNTGPSTIPKAQRMSGGSHHGSKRRWANGEANNANGEEPKAKFFRPEDEDSSSGVSTASSTAGSFTKPADHLEKAGHVAQDYLSSFGKSETRLLFRMPDGSKRYWDAPSNATVESLLSHAQRWWNVSATGYDFVMNFPFRVLNKEDPNRLLVDLGVQKHDVVYVEEK